MKRRIILIAVLMIVAWLALSWVFMWPPVCWPERTTSCGNICTNNLRIIDDAKKQWARANGKSTGEDVAILNVNKYLKNGTTPICPDGGSYLYGKMGECPICTLDGQMVPCRPAKIRVSLFTWRRAPYNPKPHQHRGRLGDAVAEPSAPRVPRAPAGALGR